ncbi:uncharacterized protein [Miscanthus floridulus]|uniref:uncharacterized protein isoform X4 n=1 Tax=Miscanthus floridulus TaxID=154761 RepID=UPI00345A1AEF
MWRRGEASPIHLLCYPSPHLESLHGTTSRLKYFPMDLVSAEFIYALKWLIIDDNRCSLLPETVEALMCTQDRLRSAIPDESSMAAEVIFPTATLSPTTNQQDYFKVWRVVLFC